jgi:hypothetical protein
MGIIAAKNIYVWDGVDYISLRPQGSGIGLIKKSMRQVSDGVGVYYIFAGMRSLFSDGIDLYYMGDTMEEIHGSDWVCQQAIDSVIGSDWICESLFKAKTL